MSEFYTRTGDDGYTGLLGKGRVPKNHPIPSAVGAVDEASAALGLARSAALDPQTGEILLGAQRDLYHLMAEVSASPENAARFRQIDEERVSWLEKQAEIISGQVEIPTEFILPGESAAGAALAMARVMVRRAERQIVGLSHNGILENPDLLRYLNRLSSLCFLLELLENQAAGADTPNLVKG